MNLHEKLVEIRKSVPYLKKDKKGEYSYASGSMVLGKLKAKMDELKVLLVPKIKDIEHSSEIRQKIKEYKGEKEVKDVLYFKVFSEIDYVWIDAEKPEDTITVPFAMFAEQTDISKAFGSALTYSERYFMLKFFQIPTDSDDPDSFQDKINPPALMTANQKQELSQLVAKLGTTKAELAKHYGIVGKTTEEEAVIIIADIKKDHAELLGEGDK